MANRKGYILSIDQGTTGSRAFIFNRLGKVVGSAYQEFPQYFPHPGWVEHDADEIWASCVSVIKSALAKARVSPSRIEAIGITNQRETTVVWERKTSTPVARAIVWQCRRTAEMCRKLKKYEPLFRKKTGLVLDAYFSGTKVRWILDHHPRLQKKARTGEICFGTIDSWLIWKLTGGAAHVTDMTNASRTLLFNIKTKTWDKELLKILKMPQAMLPDVLPSGAVFGKTFKTAGLPAGIPICAVLGDQQAALYGQGCFRPGTMKNTYGTGCFLVVNTGKKLVRSSKGLLSTIASDVHGKPVYALEGSIFIAGAVLQWLRDQCGLLSSSHESEKLIQGLSDTGGVYFVPAFTGLGAPYWDSDARGLIAGLTRGSQKRHIIRAALESIAYQTKDVFDLMKKDFGKSMTELKVDGGACRNNFLMQFQANMLSCKVVRPKNIDSTVLGAALLAGLTAGIWTSERQLLKILRRDKIFFPKMSPRDRDEKYRGWQKAVRQARVQ